jgi:hypothetical protein
MATRKILRVAISKTRIRFYPDISPVVFTLKLGIIQMLGRVVNLRCRHFLLYLFNKFSQSYAIFKNSMFLQQ